MSSNNRLKDYIQLMRLDKPVGIYLLLWPTLWGLWFAADGIPHWHILLVFVAGVVLMRSAGCVINDYADRKIDPHVARTAQRPLAEGRISNRAALTLFACLCLTAYALVLTLNLLTIGMSFIALLLAASYPFHKRFTNLPQAHLGAAFGWAIPMGFAAVQNQLPPIAILLWFTVMLWAMAYDTLYALVDREDDLKIGVKSSAILFGRYDLLIVGLLQSAVICLLVLAGFWANLGWPYGLGLTFAACIAAYQQWLVRERDPSACFSAFLNNHWFGAAVFAGLFVDRLMY